MNSVLKEKKDRIEGFENEYSRIVAEKNAIKNSISINKDYLQMLEDKAEDLEIKISALKKRINKDLYEYGECIRRLEEIEKSMMVLEDDGVEESA